MTKLVRRLVVAVLIVILIAVPFSLSFAGSKQSYHREIILFDRSTGHDLQDALIGRYGYSLKHLDLINATVALIPSNKKTTLAQEKGVLDVEDDVDVFATTNLLSARTLTQIVPWGVERINAGLAWRLSEGSGVKIGVLDTGIQLDHPDLASNIKGGFNAIDHKQSADDDCGHGTHVAGIIAAEDNNIGVVGTAPQAELYAVKVLDNTGSGKVSDVIEGIQWCVDNHIQVANMSFGTSSYSKALNSAVKKASSGGLIMVAAAGNRGPGTNTVDYPAKFDEVVAVSATDENNAITPWSSRGPEVDITAPGSNIFSTYINGDYMALSGTSMAAPHVAGAIALKLAHNPELTSTSVISMLKGTATYLPAATTEEQGTGLVNAYELVSAKQ